MPAKSLERVARQIIARCKKQRATLMVGSADFGPGLGRGLRSDCDAVPRTRANDIVLGRRAITIDTAIRLGRYFGASSEFRINL